MDAKLTRVFWAWHFWAGLIATPVLIVISITGGLYIFKSELELWWYHDIAAAPFELESLRLNDAAEKVRRTLRDGDRITSIELHPHGTRAPALVAVEDGAEHGIRRFFINPQDQTILGEIPKPNFFTFVLDLHRTLTVGIPGRILVELTTGWVMAVMLLGLAIWWPRNWRKLHGVLIPRLRRSQYVSLRDLHAIVGAAFTPLLMSIAATGLLYTLVWGGIVRTTGFYTGQFDILVAPPQSQSDPSAPGLSIDEILGLVCDMNLAADRISINLPQTESDAIAVTMGGSWGPSVFRAVHFDRATGKVVSDLSLGQLPPMAIYTQWNYPLHVGSVMGLTTKWIWLLASLVMALLPILGVAMWLTRRRPGRSGFPKRGDAIRPRWLALILIVVGLTLPTVGLSMLMVGALGWLRRLRRQDPSIASIQ
ncbi:MAG: PepSY-associated TM helix domain-containing protein [Planctomycetota bacterium]